MIGLLSEAYFFFKNKIPLYTLFTNEFSAAQVHRTGAGRSPDAARWCMARSR